ncbi:MAG: hypothetical protein U9R46_13795 [Bacteroidota bacterium]|nr:hypothetical protein [Bacteroidota bacterium]
MRPLLIFCFIVSVFITNTDAQVISIDSLHKILHGSLPIDEKKKILLASFQSHIKNDDSVALVTFITQATKDALKVNRQQLGPMSFFMSGQAYYQVRNTQEQINSTKMAFDSAKLYNETRIIINSATVLRGFASQHGENEEALRYSLEGLKASEQLNVPRGLSVASMNVGHSLKSLGRIQEAIPYYRKSYAYALLDKNPTLIPFSLISLGNAMDADNKGDSALFYYRNAQKYSDSAKELRALAYAINNIGEYFYKSSKLDSSLLYYQRSLDLSRKIPQGADDIEVSSLLEIAKILGIQKKYSQSNDSLFKTLKIAEQKRVTSKKADIYKAFVDNYENLKDTVKAFIYLEKLIDVLSSSNLEEKNAFNLLIDNKEERSRNEKLQLNIQKLEALKKQISAENKEKISEFKKQQADSIANYNSKLAETAIAQKNREIFLKTQAEKKTKEAVALNETISQRNFSLVISIIVITGLALIIYVFFRRDRKKSSIIKSTLTQKLLFTDVATHDIKRLVGNIPQMIENRLRDNLSQNPKVYGLVKHTENISQYLKNIINQKENELRKISEEIELSKMYVNIFKETTLSDEYEVTFINNITDEYLLNQIPIPAGFLNNFFKNSVEQGTADMNQTQITITLSSERIQNGYKLIIDDTGCGINYAKKTGGTTSGRGLTLARETVVGYNLKNHVYKIVFTNDSIFDKEDRNMGRGTMVVIEFIKK